MNHNKPGAQKLPLLTWLKQPFPLINEASYNWKIIIAISLFISFFLLIFQPFGLREITIPHKELFIAGYGGVTFLTVVQCHRTFLVNTEKIIRASGNAQGFTLQLKDLPETIPVSRKYVPQIRKSLDL